MKVEPAEITWNASGAPYSTRFGDIYSSHDAAAEVHRVFLAPAGLPERLTQNSALTVAELGFGTGLNFTTLAALASRTSCRLHYLGAELHPLRAGDLARLRSRQQGDELACFDALIAGWPPLLPGWHRRSLAGGRICLSLWFGSADSFLTELESRQLQGIDAWFLDGFSPDRNPGMWSESLWKRMAASSRCGATVTTFTSAGRVRRGLEAAGFEMRRVDQRPVKRESLAGVFTGNGRAFRQPECVQILGAGIAGCSLAAHFAAAGINVRLLEPLGSVATCASSMHASQHARLLADQSPLAQWRVTSHTYSLAYTRGREGVDPVGAVQLPGPNADEDRLERTFACYEGTGDWLQPAAPADVAQLAGITWRPESGGLLFPGAPAVSLPDLCKDLITAPEICLEYTAVPDPELPLILANAEGIRGRAEFTSIPLHLLWGQAEHVVFTTPPRIALLGDGYVLPAAGKCIVGSTYEYTPWDPARSTAANLQRFAGHEHRWLGHQRAARLVAADRMPLVGQIEDVWVSSAHGSMGATSAHLSAAVVQSLMCGWVPPVDVAVLDAVTPQRFARRAERRLSRRSPAR